MPEHLRKILLVIHTNTYFTGLLPLAQVLQRCGEFVPVLLFVNRYPTLPDDMEVCRKENIKVLLGERAGATSHGDTVWREQDTKLKRDIKQSKSLRVLAGSKLARLFARSAFDVLRKLSRQISVVRQLLRQEQISLVVLPADNRYDQAAYVKAAHLEHTGVVVVPQFMAGPLEWAEYIWDKSAFQVGGFQNRLAAILYPRWTFHYKGRKLIALPGSDVIAREWLKIAPPLPWILHSGASNVLALESEAVQDYCTAEGLPLSKMIVTGSIAQDAMFDTLTHAQEKRRELCVALGLDENRPLILSALPPDNLYMGRPECDFQTYAELVKFWCESISLVQGYNHVVVLHPSLRYDDMKYIEDFGLEITRMPTADIIPLCDIYIASISSTIQWAIACGKPVLNYDVFRYRYTDYQGVGGVISVEEQEEFLSVLKKLTIDASYRALVASLQKESAEHWGRLDGKAAQRLQDLFRSTIATYTWEAH